MHALLSSITDSHTPEMMQEEYDIIKEAHKEVSASISHVSELWEKCFCSSLRSPR